MRWRVDDGLYGCLRMPFEIVTWSGPLPILATPSITISAEEAVRTASLDLQPPAEGVGVYPGEAVTLSASGELLLTGYVRDVLPAFTESSHTLSVNLVSRTVDYVEASADHPTGEILDKDLMQIAKELDSYGVGIEGDVVLPKEARHKLAVGETAFASIERRARGRGVLIHDTPKGRLKLADRPAGVHSGALVEGVNFRTGSATFTERGRYSEVRVRGQASEGIDKPQLRPETRALDRGVSRRRVLILPHEGEVTLDRMKKRAAWQANRAAGNAVTAEGTTTGWRDAGGRIWTPNWLIQVVSPRLEIDGMMIIKSVTLSQTDGTTASLSLADPRGLGGENPRGKTGKGYAAPGKIDADYEDE